MAKTGNKAKITKTPPPKMEQQQQQEQAQTAPATPSRMGLTLTPVDLLVQWAGTALVVFLVIKVMIRSNPGA